MGLPFVEYLSLDMIMEQVAVESKRKVRISIIIPAKNEEKNIGKCLEAVFNQETEFFSEVIIIDSDSSDQTIDVAKSYSSVQIVNIRADEFGHGKTRNLGAEKAQGDFLVFLNADAIPADKYWLDCLINPLITDNEIAGVYSRHLPKDGCYLYMVRDIQKSMPWKSILRSETKVFDFMLFSTVSCAIRRDTWKKYPFMDKIIIAEDQQWAERVLQQGLKILYEPASKVYHSHNYTPRQLFEIKRNVAKSVRKFKSRFCALIGGLILILGGVAIKVIGDIIFIFFRYKGPFSRKLREVKISIKARIAGFWGRYKGWISKYRE
jgi:rhamnosyltransferase